MTRVPAVTRALGAILLAGSAVFGATPPAAVASVLPPDPPAILVVGPATALGDGRTVLLDGTLNGSAVMDFIRPSGAGEDPTSWVMQLTPVDGSSFATEAPGWALPIGSSSPMSVTFSWSAGAAPVSIDVRAIAADGAYSEPTTIVLRTDASSPAVAKASAAVKSGAISLAWTETSTAPVTAREVVTETAPLASAGCGTWGAPAAVALPSPAGQAPTGGGLVSAASTVIPATGNDPVAAKAPVVTAGGGGSISLGTPVESTCYRFTVRVQDALGRTSATTSSVLQVPAGAPTVSDVGTGPWKGSVDLYRKGTFVSQATPTWCVAASAQMMINLVSKKPDTTVKTQKAIMTWAQSHDGETAGVVLTKRGTDAVGWTSALAHFGAGKYALVTSRTLADALRAAAAAIRTTGRPVGLFAMGGQHAWVMTGFAATADPLGDDPWKVTSVRVAGPLWPYVNPAGYDPTPDASLSVSTLAKFFKPAFGTKTWQLIVPVK